MSRAAKGNLVRAIARAVTVRTLPRNASGIVNIADSRGRVHRLNIARSTLTRAKLSPPEAFAAWCEQLLAVNNLRKRVTDADEVVALAQAELDRAEIVVTAAQGELAHKREELEQAEALLARLHVAARGRGKT